MTETAKHPRYRIEIRILGMTVHYLETGDFAAARDYYRRHADALNCWTQVYLEGEPLKRAQADRLFKPDMRQEAWNRQMARDARRKPKRKEHVNDH